MAYADLLEKEGINSQFLIVMRPRRQVTSWDVVAGSIYKAAFDFGDVSSVRTDVETLTEASSSSLAAGQWYWDPETEYLYVRTTAGGDPDLRVVVATYEIHLGTFDAHWYRDPKDNTSRQVYYEPLVSRSPSFVNSAEDNLFGFLPINSGSIEISNATHFFEKHLYDSSWNKCEIIVYHWLDELSISNISKVFTAVGSNIEYTDRAVTFQIFDRVDAFQNEFRHHVGSFFDTDDFPLLDPFYQERPIRKVYGTVQGFIPANVNYDASSFGLTTNSKFVVMKGAANLPRISTVAPASPACTTTRTYVTTITGFRVGQVVYLARGTTYYQRTITVVGANYIEHTAIGVALLPADSILKSFIRNVYVEIEGIRYALDYGKGWIEKLNFANDSVGFEFASNYVVDMSLPRAFQPSDLIFCDVDGQENISTIGASPFGSQYQDKDPTRNGIVILYDLIRQAEFEESEIDTAAFVALEATITEKIGFAVPQNNSENFPTYKELMVDILQTLLLRMFQNNSGKWTITQLSPTGSVDMNIDGTEFNEDSVGYSFDYRDLISLVFVQYNYREIPVRQSSNADHYARASDSSETAEFVHNVNRQKTFTSVHTDQADAQVLATRLSYVFGDRKGKFVFAAKNRFFSTLIDDVVEVSRARLPGFEYDSETDQVRDFAVVQTQKTLGGVTILLDDQKGIQDNSGGW